MQTFLPYQSFVKSLQCLDNKRLGKQRVEAMQILNVLEGKTEAWKNHPAVKMWKGYEYQLSWYHDIAIAEWINRGFKNNMKYRRAHLSDYPNNTYNKPHWLTDEFCESHQSNLLRKDYLYYSQYGWTVTNNLSYIWPV